MSDQSDITTLRAELTKWQEAFAMFKGTPQELASAAVKDAQENKELKQQLESLKRALSYVTYQRLPLGDQVFDHLPEHWRLLVTQLLGQAL